jgi:HK97 family phage major capsid protein
MAEAMETELDQLESQSVELNRSAEGRRMSDEEVAKFNELTERAESLTRSVDSAKEELRRRQEVIRKFAERKENREPGAEFQTPRPGATRGNDIYDLSSIQVRMDDPTSGLSELRSRAKRSVEEAEFPVHIEREQAQAHIESLIERFDSPNVQDAVPGEVSRRILTTGSPAYRSAFLKELAGQPKTNEEARALSVGTGSAGGFAVVYTLDPTIIPTSNSSVNPYRRISRVESIAGTNEWRGVTSSGVSASRAAEAAEASDNSPTLAQPAVIVQRVQAFVPYSIEVSQDWGSLQSELGPMLQDAKDDEEATSFTTGAGNSATTAQGIVTGATVTVAAGGTAAFAVADIYATEQALGPRFRPRAQWLANRFTYNKIRQFDTAGGASLWLDNLRQGIPPNQTGNLPQFLIGYGANEASAMASALTTGSKIMVFGDFRYFVIVDRVGLDIEVIPHLFGSNGRPTGQRGIYAYWRNNSKVLDANAFRTLVTS